MEKYNAIKNVNEEEEKENEDEYTNKFELNYLTRNTLPIGHITNKFIGPTDEKSIINGNRLTTPAMLDYLEVKNLLDYITNLQEGNHNLLEQKGDDL